MPDGVVKLSTGAYARFSPGVGEGLLPAVLIVHGWRGEPFHEGGTYDLVSKSLNAIGYHTLLLCLRGHGCAEGDINTVTPFQNNSDIVAAFQYLAEQPDIDPARLGAFGASYGAYLLAAVASSISGFKLLALRAPALYPDIEKLDCWNRPTSEAVADPTLGSWRSELHTMVESLALSGISHFAGDLLIVPSELDEDMPPAVARSYQQAAIRGHARSVRMHILPGVGHVLQGEHREKFLVLLSKWFEEHYSTSQV